ncbi:hypothetical protein A0H81_09188 [Grifola frondosa]|uniref:Uncharacterized protein n=1 Tax=Grifola frondosa TaxID=5627 RepID=A0A1C7M283_GRIFR|nr:hypothetical protein A0H81_09188 [Grifola frondosa]
MPGPGPFDAHPLTSARAGKVEQFAFQRARSRVLRWWERTAAPHIPLPTVDARAETWLPIPITKSTAKASGKHQPPAPRLSAAHARASARTGARAHACGAGGEHIWLTLRE